MRYADEIKFRPSDLHVDSLTTALEILRGYGSAKWDEVDTISFCLDTEQLDLEEGVDVSWFLRDLLANIQQELSVNGVEFQPNSRKVTA